MEESRYHRHQPDHETNSQNEGHKRQSDTSSRSESDSIDHGSTGKQETASRTSEWKQNPTESRTKPVIVPRPDEKTLGGVQTTSSFHSVSSIDSSAEMAKYFPDAQTPSISPFRHHQEGEEQQTTSTTEAVTKTSTASSGAYATVPVPTAVKQPSVQPARAPVIVPQPQESNRKTAAPQLPLGIPGYPSQVEGLSISQVLVNDIIIDLQTKVINESQQQYYSDSSSGNYFEQMSPIYIRAPNPTIILQSDLHRLRAQLKNRPPVVTRHGGGINQFQQNTFQVPRFPHPPQQNLPSESYGEYRNTTYANM